MKKKLSAVLITGFLILGVTTPANAATAGGSCTTAGAKTTIAKNTYVCAKNPFFSTTKLTWVWDGCIELNTDYQAGIKRHKPFYVNQKKIALNKLSQLGKL